MGTGQEDKQEDGKYDKFTRPKDVLQVTRVAALRKP
jgi:hypothetical protein